MKSQLLMPEKNLEMQNGLNNKNNTTELNLLLKELEKSLLLLCNQVHSYKKLEPQILL